MLKKSILYWSKKVNVNARKNSIDLMFKSLFFFSYFFAHMKEYVILKKQEQKE
ncbi:hypothetical protein RU98_GL000239 [Enterococcus caccae]|nr:hypothetical protein RU98_GL000239 [Enterococcus caccae]